MKTRIILKGAAAITAIMLSAALAPSRIFAEEISEEMPQTDYVQEKSATANPGNGIGVNPYTHGTVDIESEFTAWCELCYWVTATPDEGYYLSSLAATDPYGNNAATWTGENYITVFDKNVFVTVNAVFTCIDPEIHASAENGEIITKVNGVESDTVEAGDTVTLEFIPDEHYEFTGDVQFVCEEMPKFEWNGNMCTFVMPGCGDLDVYTEFEPDPLFSISVNADSAFCRTKTFCKRKLLDFRN